jgi:hypothetical protein
MGVYDTRVRLILPVDEERVTSLVLSQLGMSVVAVVTVMSRLWDVVSRKRTLSGERPSRPSALQTSFEACIIKRGTTAFDPASLRRGVLVSRCALRLAVEVVGVGELHQLLCRAHHFVELLPTGRASKPR